MAWPEGGQVNGALRMRDIIDLRGASGAYYRFRSCPSAAEHLPMAGNYAFVRTEAGRPKVLVLGQCGNLSQLPQKWPKGSDPADTQLYTRLNVSRMARIAEHDDLAAHYTNAKLDSSVE